MSNRLKSKANLKKSLYFAGGISLVVGASGIAIAVPIYNDIQNKLKQNIAKLADLSKFMSQLTSKLGISADEGFSQELSGGYVVEYVDGKTQIYKNAGGTKTLVMNMNRDGTVGSAATMTGLAAQKMLSVITEAHDTLGDEAEAMDDILGPYVEAVEEKSLSIESAITGTSREELEARNALAVNTDAERAKATAELKAKGIASDVIQKAQTAATERAAEQKKLEILAGQDKAARDAAIEEARKKAEAEFQAGQAKLKQAYIDFMIADTIAKDAAGHKMYPSTERANLMLMSVEALREKFEQLQQMIMDVKSKEAVAKTTTRQMESATHSANSNSAIVQRMLAQPTSFMNTLISSFGYENGTTVKQDSPTIRRLYWSALQKEGVSKTAFANMIKFFGHDLLEIPLNELEHWDSFGHVTKPKKKVVFTERINTYTSERQDVSRILAMSADITDSNGVKSKGYFLGRSTNRHVLELENIIPIIPSLPLSSQPSGFTKADAQTSFNTLDLIMKTYESAVLPEVKLSVEKALIEMINSKSKLPQIANPARIMDIDKLSKYIASITDNKLKKSIITGIGVDLGERILIKGENLNFDAETLINAFELADTMDLKYDSDIATKDTTEIYADPVKYKFLNTLHDYLKDNINLDKTSLLKTWSDVYKEVKDPTKISKHLQDVIDDEDTFKLLVDNGSTGLIKALNNQEPEVISFFDILFGFMTKYGAIKKISNDNKGTPLNGDQIIQKARLGFAPAGIFDEIKTYADSITGDNLKKEIASHMLYELSVRKIIYGDAIVISVNDLKKALDFAYETDNRFITTPATLAAGADLVMPLSSDYKYVNALYEAIADSSVLNKSTAILPLATLYNEVHDDSSNSDAVKAVMNNKDVFRAMIDNKSYDLLRLLNSTDADYVTLFNALIAKESDLATFKKISVDNKDKAFPLTIERHIKQLIAKKADIDWTTFTTTAIEHTFILILSTQDDITQGIIDADTLLTIDPTLDITEPDNVEKLHATQSASTSMASVGIDATNAKTIEDQIKEILAKVDLTPEQFKQATYYINTAMTLVDGTPAGKAKAIAKIKVVLDPATIKTNIIKVTQFNKWVRAAYMLVHRPPTRHEIVTQSWQGQDVSIIPTPKLLATMVQGDHSVFGNRENWGDIKEVVTNPDGTQVVNDLHAPAAREYVSSGTKYVLNGVEYMITSESCRQMGGKPFDTKFRMSILRLSDKHGWVVEFDLPKQKGDSDSAHVGTSIEKITTDKDGNLYMISSLGYVYYAPTFKTDVIPNLPEDTENFKQVLHFQAVDLTGPVSGYVGMDVVRHMGFEYIDAAGDHHYVTFLRPNANCFLDYKFANGVITMKDLGTSGSITKSFFSRPGYKPTAAEIPEPLYQVMTAHKAADGEWYAYGIDANKQLWRFHLAYVTNPGLPAKDRITQTLLLDLTNKVDQNGNPLKLDRYISMIYLEGLKEGEPQIYVSTPTSILLIHDATEEITDIFNTLMP